MLRACVLVLVLAATAAAQQSPLRESWDYAGPMKKVAARFAGRPGVVLHVGDSITYSNPYGQWARGGKGKTEADKAALQWMHCGADDTTDGWWLARFDHPAGGRSHTACSGIRADEMLAGGKRQMPPLADMLKQYRPQMVLLMLGTNDASAGRTVEAFAADVQKAVDLVLDGGAVCILSTIPPHPQKTDLARSYNEALRKLAESRGLPLVDFEKEILGRRPDDWNGTLLGRGDVHPTAKSDGATPTSEPTEENLRKSGYLLRGWLSVRKIAEVKRRVVDGLPDDAAPAKPEPTPKPTTPKDDAPAARDLDGAIRLPITRDTWFSNVGHEADTNTGGSSRLKLKSIQEMSLVDFDPAPLRGRVIEAAAIHLRLAGKERLHRVTASTFASEWVEGTASSYTPQPGSSTFNHQRHPDAPWAGPQSDLTAVMLGCGGTIWRMADASKPNADGWQQVPVDPLVVAARAAGVSYGLLLFDDTGSEWTRQGERFEYRNYPNRFVHSRESGEKNAPYLSVVLGAEDRQPPEAPKALQCDDKATAAMPAASIELTWDTPADRGPAGVIGFQASMNGNPVPRWQIPAAGRPGEPVRMVLNGAGETVEVSVSAIDAAGNVGPAATGRFRTSTATETKLAGSAPRVYPGVGPLPELAGAKVAIVDPLDKVHPVTGRMIPEQPQGYLVANHLWSAGRNLVRLGAARNEFVAFQVVVEGSLRGLEASLEFEKGQGGQPRVTWGRFGYVESKLGPLPDPVLPIDGPVDLPDPKRPIAGQTRSSLLCEVYVPHDAATKSHSGTLRLRSGKEVVEIPVVLWVWNFTLPDYLSFLPEMNCYGLPDGERDYYRLAHEHRTVLNRVPYSQRGDVHSGAAPAWDGKRLDWEAWDRRFGPLLDGSAFGDLPRKGVPVEVFYLPLHENWPSPMEGNYSGSYWADQAFPPAYRAAFVEVSRQMAEHFRERRWSETLFQCYLNNKHNFKRDGWSRGSSPWLLDEPASFQDYWALRYYGECFLEGARAARSSGEPAAKMLFRCDISRPEWQRNSLDHVLGYNVVGGGAFRRYHDLVLERKEEFGQVVLDYGTTCTVEQSNMQPVGWCLDSWTLGSDGVLPWQTIGGEGSWQKADQLSLFYPGRPAGLERPVPSIRLKAYRRGQQDVEYLTLWQRQAGQPRWATGAAIRDTLKLKATTEGTGVGGGAEDAGRVAVGDLRPQDVWALRVRLATAISAAHPEPKRRLRDWNAPALPATTPPAMVEGAVVVETVRTESPPAAASGEARLLQGRAVVRDTLIDPQEPDRNFGSTARDNRVARRNDVSALLVQFDIASLRLPKQVRVEKAVLRFYVWDPSSKGRTKVSAFALKTPWDEATATWQQPAVGRKWAGGDGFSFAADAGPPVGQTIVAPDRGSDTADPPIEYAIDVTEIVRGWVSGGSPNHGLAIAPVIDRTVDDGQWSRLQVLASEYSKADQTPSLEIRLR